jgi:uncharacterized SAM-binding protein YcdF (DUF218 family)
MSPVVGLRTRRSRLAAALVVVLVLVFVALTLRLFVYPDLNAPEHADAIVVLGTSEANAYSEGVALAHQGFAPAIALSIPSYDCVHSLAAAPTVRVLCFSPDPQTTQGEARSIAHMASEYHWRRIIVVMSTTQATRARLRIGRCYAGQVLEVAATPSGFWSWVDNIVYEWGALAKALVTQRGC